MSFIALNILESRTLVRSMLTFLCGTSNFINGMIRLACFGFYFQYACTKTQHYDKKVMIIHTLYHAVFVTGRFWSLFHVTRWLYLLCCVPFTKALASFAFVLPFGRQDVVRMAVTLISNLWDISLLFHCNFFVCKCDQKEICESYLCIWYDTL